MGNSTGKSTEVAVATQLIAGTNSQFTKTQKLSFASDTFTPAQVLAQLTLLVTLRQAVDAARAALAAKLSAENAQLPALRAFMKVYKAFVLATFSNSPDVLAAFGLEPKTKKTPSV